MRRIILWMYLLLATTPLLVGSCYEREGAIGQSDLQTKPSAQMLARVMAYVQAHEQQMDFLTERNFSSKDMKVRKAMYRHFTGRQDTYTEAGQLVHAIKIYNGWYDPQLTIKPADSNDSTYAKNYDGQVAAPWRRR